MFASRLAHVVPPIHNRYNQGSHSNSFACLSVDATSPGGYMHGRLALKYAIYPLWYVPNVQCRAIEQVGGGDRPTIGR